MKDSLAFLSKFLKPEFKRWELSDFKRRELFRVWLKHFHNAAKKYDPLKGLSYIFSECSLDGLVQDLKKRKPNHPFEILAQSQVCQTDGVFDETKFSMLKNGKSKLPYDKLTWDYLFSTTEVPPEKDYHSELTNTDIDKSTYEDIKKIWSFFKIKNLAEYSSIYVSSDVLLLAEVFSEFRSSIISWSKLDPDFYLGDVNS